MNLKSLIERKLEPVGYSAEDTIYRCPLCNDSSGHMYVDYHKGYWHCFRCDAGGKSIESLLRVLGLSIDYNYDKLYNEQSRELDQVLSLKISNVVEEDIVDYSTDLSILHEYYNLHTKPLSSQALEYLYKRKITPLQISRLDIREGIDMYGRKLLIKGKEFEGRDYSDRILVPSRRQDGTISFYVARDYIGDKKAKYLNPPKELAVASEDVWNLDMIESESVIICEGVFTAIAASPIKLNACATYGKSIAQKSSSTDIRVTSQGEKLLAKKFKNYYVAYDADALSESLKTCQYLYDRGANVYLIRVDPLKYGAHADIADIGYEEFLKLLSSATKYEGPLNELNL